MLSYLKACLLLALALILGCSSNSSNPAFSSPWKSTGKIKVLTSIVPVYCLAKMVAGDDAEVLCLMVSHGPHDYAPTHDDVKILAEADILAIVGFGLEDFINNMVKGADNRKLKVVRTGLAMPTEMRLQGEATSHYHGDKLVQHPAGVDPHIWLGMDEAACMADAISEALIERDPKNAAAYKTRTAELKKKLTDLKAKGTEQLKNAKGGLITFHDSFRYFSRSFGITIAGTIRNVKGDQPLSPAALREQAEEFRKKGVRVIGVEPQFPRGVAENLAKEIDAKNARIIELDPIETGPTLPGSPYQTKPTYYLDKLEQNLSNLQKAYE